MEIKISFYSHPPVGAVCNRGPHPLLERGVPTRYWEGTLNSVPVGAVCNRTEFCVKVITESTITDN